MFGAKDPFEPPLFSITTALNQSLFFLDVVLKVYVSVISRFFPPQIIPRMHDLKRSAGC